MKHKIKLTVLLALIVIATPVAGAMSYQFMRSQFPLPSFDIGMVFSCILLMVGCALGIVFINTKDL